MIKTRVENGAGSKLGLLNNSHSFQLIKWLLENYGQKGLPSSSDRELTTRAQATLQNYETNLRLVCMLASAYGFKTYFFWQPALAHGAKPLAPFEQELKQARSKELGGRVHRGLKAVYQEAETRSAAFDGLSF